jgi:hypothetical protein
MFSGAWRHFENVAKMLTSAPLQRSLCIKFLDRFSNASAIAQHHRHLVPVNGSTLPSCQEESTQ